MDITAYRRHQEQLLTEIEQLIQELEQLRPTEQKDKTASAADRLENKLRQLVALTALKKPSNHP